MSHEPEQIKRIVEAALLAAGEPLTVQRLASLFEDEEKPATDVLKAVLEDIETECEGRGFELRKIASGYRFQVREDLATWIGRLWEEKPQRYSRATLETLALIAYRQPITRGDIEEIRGVAVSSNIIKTLMERNWVRVVGHRDVPGRPELFATTKGFLDYFNLNRLEDLPPLADIRDLESINGELEFAAPAEQSEDVQAEDGQPADAPQATGESAAAAPEAAAENTAAAEADAEPGEQPAQVADASGDRETEAAPSEAPQATAAETDADNAEAVDNTADSAVKHPAEADVN